MLENIIHTKKKRYTIKKNKKKCSSYFFSLWDEINVNHFLNFN